MKMPDGLEYWTPDEVAECLEGVTHDTYRRLWLLLEDLEPMPVGGDGSNGTLETPPEPDLYLDRKMGAVWSKLTDAEQQELSTCWEQHLRRF